MMNIDKYIPRDKQLHMIAGAVIALSFGGIFYALGIPHPPLLGVVMSIVGGAFKELADLVINTWEKSHNAPPTHDVDWKDVAFTVLGGVIPMVPFAFYLKGF